MSVFFRARPPAGPARSVFPSTTFGAVANAIVSGSFAEVDLSSAETSLQKVAIGASTDLIASIASELPVDVYQGRDRDKRQLSTPSYLEDPAGDGYGREDWVYQLLMSHLLRGNVFGDILDVAAGGFPTQIALFHPDMVSGWLDPESGRPLWTAYGERVKEGRMWHRRSYPMPGRLLGVSPIARHMTTVGLAISATRFGAQWFRDGAHPGGVLQNTVLENVDPTVARTVKDRFLAAVRGNREPVVMGKQWEWKPIQVNPEESQFLETNEFTAAECCRMYGPGLAEILGYDTGGSMTYTNQVERANDLLKYSLNRWLNRADRALTSMLPRGQWVRLNRDAVLESTTLQRYQAHASALTNQWKTPNEVRELEELPPAEWGNQPIKKGAEQLPAADKAKDGPAS